MRRVLVLVFALLPACASARVTVRVRDPWQVAVVRVTDVGDVPLRTSGSACAWRDADGSPHFCQRGDFAVAFDGAITTPSVRRFGETVRLVAHLQRETRCRKPRRRCLLNDGEIAFVTSAANVLGIWPAVPPEPPRPPVGH